MSEPDERLILKSVVRAFGVLETLGREARSMSLGGLADAAGIDKSSAQRIAHTLLSMGYFERAPDGGVILGRRLLDRSFDYLRSNSLIERATPILIELRKTVGERVDLSLLDDLTIVYVVRQQSKRETFFATLAGRRIPTFYSSGGRAAMALLDDATVNSILKRSNRRAATPKTITKIDEIWKKIHEARANGYAHAVEEGLIGEIVLAAAIVDKAGRPLGAIHIAGSLSEWTVEKFCQRFSPLAVEAARTLGGR